MFAVAGWLGGVSPGRLDHMIKGNLSSFSLGEIFQSLAVNNHTGTLKIQEKNGEEKYLYFSKGEICLFSSKSHPSLRVGEILVRQGVLERSSLERALEEQKDSKEKLGKILTKSYGVKASQLQAALETKIREEVYDLFLLNDAAFEFLVDNFPEEIFDSFQKNLHISINTTAVLMEGLRLADEWKVIEKKIRSFDEIFVLERSSGIEVKTPQQRAIVQLVDGATSVHHLFERFPGSRFDCCKTLFEFLEAGALRPLTLNECRDAGKRAAQKEDFERAVQFLKFAVQLAPDRPDPLIHVAELLGRIGRDEEAFQSTRTAVLLYFKNGDFEKVVKHGEALIERVERDEPLLNAVFHSSLEQGRQELVEFSGNKLCEDLLARGAKAHAAEVLLKICNLSPRDMRRRHRTAELLKESGDIQRGVAFLEDGLKYVEGKQLIGERIRLLRHILDLDPDRGEINEEISELRIRQQQIQQRKKRQTSIVGIAVIVGLLLMLIPFMYELKARELMSHAQRMEEISLSSPSGTYQAPLTAYRKLVEDYPWSTQYSAADSAIQRLEALESERLANVDRERFRKEEERERLIRLEKAELGNRLKKVEEHERLGQYRLAFGELKQILSDYKERPGIDELQLPLVITSSPPGCEILANGKPLGHTPYVLRGKSGDKLEVHLSRSGCEAAQRDVRFGDEWFAHFDMKLRPLAQFHLSGPVHRPMRNYQTDILFVSRDGFFYSVNPTAQKVNWRRRVGHEGDLTSSPLYLEEEILLGDVAGILTPVSRQSGKSRWHAQLGATILAKPAVSPDGRWVAAGDLAGRMHLVDFHTGKIVDSYQAENEFVRAPRFWRERLIAPCEDHSLYVFSTPKLEVLGTIGLEHPLVNDPLIHGETLVLPLADGTVSAHDLKSLETRWTRKLENVVSNRPRTFGGSLLVGTENGEVVALNLGNGELIWRAVAGETPSALGDMTIDRNRIYLGTASGEIVSVDLRSRQRSWGFRADEPIAIAPLVLGRHLFVVSVTGKFFVMEIFK